MSEHLINAVPTEPIKRELLDKICCRCKKSKPKSVDYFGFSKSNKDGFHKVCKICRKSEVKSDKIKKSNWYKADKANNPEKYINRHDTQNAKGKARKTEWYKKVGKNRLRSNKTIQLWRSILKRSHNCNTKINSVSCKGSLGYTPDELRKHIEALWTPQMCWDNYGEWHIDHIIPLYLFPKEAPANVVNCLNNLRPLWKTNRIIDNVEYKGNLNRRKENIKLTLPRTYFLDIDGCLIEHDGNHTEIITTNRRILPGVLQKMNEWSKVNSKIILTTARRESSRDQTEKQLKSLGLFWDVLIMGVGNGQRVVINDLKPGSYEATAIAINIPRNVGLEDIDIDKYCKINTLALLYGVKLPTF